MIEKKIYQDSEYGVAEYDTAGSLRAGRIPEHQMVIETTHTLRGEGFDASEDGTGRGTPLVPVAYSIQGNMIGRCDSAGPQGVGVGVEVSFTQTKADVHAIAYIGGIDYENNAHTMDEPTGPLLKGSPTGGGRPLPAVGFAQNTRDEVRLINGDGQIAGALAAEPGMKQQTYCAVSPAPTLSVRTANTSSNGWGVQEEVTHTLDQTTGPAIATPMQLRRLTPRECERLQGFPDDYTNIPWRKQPTSPDGPRYKALGNSMAVPVMRWIGEGILHFDRGEGK